MNALEKQMQRCLRECGFVIIGGEDGMASGSVSVKTIDTFSGEVTEQRFTVRRRATDADIMACEKALGRPHHKSPGMTYYVCITD